MIYPNKISKNEKNNNLEISNKVFTFVFPKNINMDSMLEMIDNQIKEAKTKRKNLILEAMDGRSQRYVAEKVGMDETKLSRWINSEATLEPDELKKLNKYLGVEFK